MESGGNGGKFRKKPSRRTNSTPYDRPLTALRPTQLREKNNSWLSKLVDPASRLITAGAHKLFSSVFSNRLLPPPQPKPQLSPDETTEFKDAQPENTIMVAHSGSKQAIVCRGTDLSGVTDSGGVAELENLLKQKTFTRSEIDHLTALLMSRTVDSLVGSEKGTPDPNISGEKAVHSRREILTDLPSLENRVEHAAISTPVVKSKVLDDVVGSPADLAKAYMGSRPARASPSVPVLKNDKLREDLSATYNSFSKPKSSAMSLIQRPSSDIKASEQGFTTPRFRGRSAIYTMARTPFSRLHPAEVFKAAEIASDFYGASTSSHNAADLQQLSESKRQVLKRRSTVLESDIGFVGPIRRIRQKPNLLHHKNLPLPAYGSVHTKHGCECVTDATELPASINWKSHHRSSTKGLADTGMPSTSNGYVPTQSIKTAEKIFQHLDNLTQKGKSPEKKISIVEGSSPEKSDMQDELVQKSRSNIESFKVLQTSVGNRKENGLLDHENAQDISPKISSRVEVSVKKFVIPSCEGVSENGSPNNALDNMIARSTSCQQQRVFQISAHEDYLEPDGDVLTNGTASTPTVKGVDSSDLGKNSGAISVQPSSCATSMTSTHAAVSSFSIAEMDKASRLNEKVNEINSNNSNSAKLAPVSFSPLYSTLESAASTGMKMELLRSEFSAVAKVDEPAKTDKKNTLLFADASKKIEDTPSAPNAAKGFLTFGLPSNSAILSNGLSSSNGESPPTKISSISNDQAPVAMSLPVLSFSNGDALFTSTVACSMGPVISTSTTGKTATSHISSGSQVPTSVAAPPVSSGSTFQFGSSAIVSTSATVGTAALESATKTEAELNGNLFGNLTSIPLTAKPSGTASVGSDIPELTAAFKTGGSETPIAATPAFPGGPIFGLQAVSSSPDIGAPISTQALSNQLALPASSSIFGLSGPTGFDASKTGNPFAPPVSTSASSALGTSTVTATISSSSNSTISGIFGWQSSTPTAPFGMSSQSTKFAFGSASGSTSAANSSTSPTMFGASSNTLITSSSAPFLFQSTSSSVFSSPSAVGSTPAASSQAFPSVFSAPSASSKAFSTQSTFGFSTAQPFTFGSTPPGGNNDQMSMEDSMAEDSVQVPAPSASVFGAPISGPGSFVFSGGAPTATATATATASPSMGSPFQFGGQQTPQIGSQNTPFQPSGGFGAGSFSLGSGGGDKSNRRIVKVKNRIRKK